jgi:phosphotriesterase-related protein
VVLQVPTVTGPIPADDLGFTLVHEHLLVDMFRQTRRMDLVLDDEDLAVGELALFQQAGGTTLVDVTVPGMGRNPAALRRIAERAGVHILMGTGRYRETYYEPELWRRSTQDIALEFIAELEDGVGTEAERVYPAVIGEIGVDGYHMSPVEERVHRAAGRAQKRTGRPITTHALFSKVGLWQLDVFEEEGADLRRVAIGHSDSYPHLDYYVEIARRGAFVEFDLLHASGNYESRARVRLLHQVLDAGLVSSLLLSHDVCSRQHLVAYGGTGYANLPARLIPEMKAAGISADAVHQMTVVNPRRFLTGAA